MTVSREAITLLILIGVGVLGGGYVAAHSVRTDPPDFSVPTTDNQTFTLHGHRGQVVVLDFMATTCAPCRIVEKSLKEAVPAWNQSQVVVLSVAQWGEDLPELRRYKAAENVTWPLAPDPDKSISLKYNTFEIPHLIVLDRAGRVVYESGRDLPDAAKLRTTVAAALDDRLQPFGLVHYGLLGLAMVAGAAAFFSPCAIGMLPSYVAHTLRAEEATGTRRPRILRVGLLAAAGVLLVFFGIGGLALVAGPALTKYVPFLQPLVGFVLIALGILLLVRPYSVWVQRRLAPLSAWASDVDAQGARNASFFAYGVAYGAAASGCTLPVLLGILVTAAAYGAFVGTGIVLAYALTGAFLMVLLTAIAATFRHGFAARLVRYSRVIEAVAALLFVLGGCYLLWIAGRAGTFAT
jgi:cytochrome c-type biogenesis protein